MFHHGLPAPLDIGLVLPQPVPQPAQRDGEQQGASHDFAGSADPLRSHLPSSPDKVADKNEGRRPDDATRGIEDEESQIGHAAGSRDKRHQGPHQMHEMTGENGLAAMPIEEALCAVQALLMKSKPPPLFQQPSSSQIPPKLIADGVAENGGGGDYENEIPEIEQP